MLQEVSDFWFALDPSQWWKSDPVLDEIIRARFEPLWCEQRSRVPEEFTTDAASALAAILLFDQLPRNMFRGDAEQFATDPLALRIAAAAVDRGFDAQADPARRAFFYLPFEHSEAMDDQRRSLLLFTRLGDPMLLDYARKHFNVIERFGRFPHRNAMLGRQPTAQEQAAGEVTPF